MSQDTKRRRKTGVNFGTLPYSICFHITSEWYSIDLTEIDMYNDKYKLLDFYGYFGKDPSRKLYSLFLSFSVTCNKLARAH